MRGVYNPGKPNPKQKQFLMSTARYVGFGGARGGGKSWAVRTKAVLLAFRYPGIKILIVRRTFPELEENHIRVLREQLAGIATYNGSNKRFTFPNGSTISLTYCSTDNDLQHVQGTEWHAIFIDEATNLTEYQIKVIQATNRSADDIPKRMFFTMNPGGVGHAYIKRLFIDRNFEQGEDPDDYVFIQSLVWDNEFLCKDGDYMKILQNLPAEKRKGWLDGEWDIYEGQVFTEWRNNPNRDNTWTHVIEPFDVPREWKVYHCFDWGYSRPFACYWFAVAPNGQKFVIREYYGCTGEPNKGVETQHMEVAEQIHHIETTDPNLVGRKIIGPADPAIFSTDSHGATIAGDMLKAPNYVFFSRGKNDRLNGKMQVHYHLAFDEDGVPMLQVFNTCKHLIRTLPNLLYDEKHIEDINTDMEDHAYDALRYGLMDYPIMPRGNHTKKVAEPDYDPLNLHKTKRPFGHV